MRLVDRQTILEASRRLTLAGGFRSLTMRRVAAAVGVSAPALYRHFEGKGALIAALVEEARAAFAAELERALGGATPWERLRLAERAFLRFALDRPEAYELLMLTPNQLGLFRTPDSLDRWRDEPPPSFRFCVERVAECMAAGDLASGDATEVALTLSGLGHGLVTQFLAGRFGTDREAFTALYTSCFDKLYAGIRPPSEP